MVSVLAFTPSSNPAEVYNFSVLVVVGTDENKHKEAGIGRFLYIEVQVMTVEYVNVRPQWMIGTNQLALSYEWGGGIH